MGAFEERDINYDASTIPDTLKVAHRISKVQNHRVTDGQLESLGYAFRTSIDNRPITCDFGKLEVTKKDKRTSVSIPIRFLGGEYMLQGEV